MSSDMPITGKEKYIDLLLTNKSGVNFDRVLDKLQPNAHWGETTSCTPSELLVFTELRLSVAIYAFGLASPQAFACLSALAQALYVVCLDSDRKRKQDMIDVYAAACLLSNLHNQNVHVPELFQKEVNEAKAILAVNSPLNTYALTLCEQSSGNEGDWVAVYESSFPADERVAVDVIRRDLSTGRRLLHRSLSASGELLCFSLVFTELTEFVWLSYIATVPNKRSQGIGAKHLLKLISLMQAKFPEKKALLLEIESISAAQNEAARVERQRRLTFYQRLGAERLSNVQYLMPNFVEGKDPIAAELMWHEFYPGAVKRGTLRDGIREIYEKIYGLAPSDPLIDQITNQI
jgi:hypothetical protein